MISCAKERPYLSGHIKRAHDAVMVPCDPYGLGKFHTCLVFSAAFRESLYVFDATAGEMVLAPMSYFPLKIKVGRLTDHLVIVMSEEKRFPWMFALDHAKALVFPVRLFPDGKMRSFSEPESQALPKAPFKMAVLDVAGKLIGIATLPNEGGIELWAFERETGKINSTIAAKAIKVGTRPTHVEIDRDRKVAVISDEGEKNIHVLDLANIDDVLTKGSAPSLKTISVDMPMERVYLSRRDFGAGSQLYAIGLSVSGNDITLVNIDGSAKEASITLAEYPMAAYFPDDKSDPCCEGIKHWFSVATIKGNLIYVVVKRENAAVKLEKSTVVELTSENNLSLSKLSVCKILGGYVEPDSSVDRENICPRHRQSFIIVFYGNSRSYLNTESVEVEANSYMCEGEGTASRFGFKPN